MSDAAIGTSSATVHFEDRALAVRMRAGDESAIAQFAERTIAPLYRFALARLDGDRELALEIAQTTMTKALANLGGYRGEAALLTWLCACCRNEIRMHWRRRQSAPATIEIGDDVETSAGLSSGVADGIEADLLRREETLRVHMALDGMSEHHARALEWKYVDRLSVEEIAARLALSPKAAESMLSRARQAFRTSYARAGAALGATETGGPGKVEHGRARPAL